MQADTQSPQLTSKQLSETICDARVSIIKKTPHFWVRTVFLVFVLHTSGMMIVFDALFERLKMMHPDPNLQQHTRIHTKHKQPNHFNAIAVTHGSVGRK